MFVSFAANNFKQFSGKWTFTLSFHFPHRIAGVTVILMLLLFKLIASLRIFMRGRVLIEDCFCSRLCLRNFVEHLLFLLKNLLNTIITGVQTLRKEEALVGGAFSEYWEYHREILYPFSLYWVYVCWPGVSSARPSRSPAGGEDMCGDSMVRPSWWCLFSQWMAEATSDINIRNNGGITLHLRSVCDLATPRCEEYNIRCQPRAEVGWKEIRKFIQWGEVLKCTPSMAEATHGSRLSALVTSTPPSGVRTPAPSGEWWHAGAGAPD